MTRLCVAIFANTPDQAKRDIAVAAEAGADMVELRIDSMNDADDVLGLLASATLPAVVTCRPIWEGGHCELYTPPRQTPATWISNC
jgi:3-dehydroquinate dehydratase / shikimate dehydrogenase